MYEDVNKMFVFGTLPLDYCLGYYDCLRGTILLLLMWTDSSSSWPLDLVTADMTRLGLRSWAGADVYSGCDSSFKTDL
jgi:hypothetical protein